MRLRRPEKPSLALSIATLVGCMSLTLTGCGEDASAKQSAVSPAAESGDKSSAENGAQNVPAPSTLRSLYFGDLHVHSGWSFDAYADQVTATPLDAYRYARGEAIDHASGKKIQINGPPLDFMALTDHAEYLGVVRAANNPNHPLAKQPLIRNWTGQNRQVQQNAFRRIRETFQSRKPFPVLIHDSVIQPAWQALIGLANSEYVPGEFTTFIGFEYTSNPEGRNLHRNVLFRGATAPYRPFSAMDSPNPEGLWRWMDDTRAQGHELLAIPHNSNGSDGEMFATRRFDGSATDDAWAALRARNEPVAEVMQIKGQSETHPDLSPDDEWANFSIVDVRTLDPQFKSQPKGSYGRDALKTGLELERALGMNPYRLGFIGSTDGHNASSPFEEDNYTGKIGPSDATPEKRLAMIETRPGVEPVVSITTRWGSSAGLAGIWAEANTREAIFDAIRRRETFATSGPRIRLRMHASWDAQLVAALIATPNQPETDTVPMGGVLAPPIGATPTAPSLAIHAQKDPSEAPLERLQVVKGWLKDGVAHERVIDIACMDGARPDPKSHRCPNAAPKPNLKDCSLAAGVGAADLRATWTDPDYDATQSAFYYARVIQVSTCRWSTFDALRTSQPLNSGVPPWIQERAIGSPIWVEAKQQATKP